MLFKISVSNIRRSLRDYAIYFFTLMIGVSIFYVFNAVGTQTALLMVMEGDTRSITELLSTIISNVSVFVAAVLGLLIVYASRYLMKRRSREFALYLLLGMGKAKISLILLLETLIIGIGSLAAGLAAGIGLSQLMSAFVISLFDADMRNYRFTLSVDAVWKTMGYFGVVYFVVMLFNSFIIGKCKLIDLMQSGKRSEKLRLKNVALCVILFFLAAGALGYAYHEVTYAPAGLTAKRMMCMIALGAVATLVIFWSFSGLLLRIATALKGVYFRGLNCFTFRQISSRINTMVLSMTVICLMLFVTICTLSGSFSIRNSLNDNIRTYCPADAMFIYAPDSLGKETMPDELPAPMQTLEDTLEAHFSESEKGYSYGDDDLTMGDFFDLDREVSAWIRSNLTMLDLDVPEVLVTLSDYNALMTLYGIEPLEMGENECVMLCNFEQMTALRDRVLAKIDSIPVFGHDLKLKYHSCQDGFIEIAIQPLNSGLLVIPDSVAAGQQPRFVYLAGNYAVTDTEARHAEDAALMEAYRSACIELSGAGISYYTQFNTRQDMADAAIGLGGLVALVGLYIGMTFLIACGAVLALKQLSEAADSVRYYEMLRKIGAEEKDITRSLYRQAGIFFLLPLLLAAVHSVFGMKFAGVFLTMFGTSGMTASIVTTCAVLLVIYGGYFLITCFGCKSVIRNAG